MEDLTNITPPQIRDDYDIAEKLQTFRRKAESFNVLDVDTSDFIYFYFEVAFKLRAERATEACVA